MTPNTGWCDFFQQRYL